MSLAKPPRRVQKMTRADAAWLHMEEPTNLMMITAVFLFDRPLDKQRFRDAIEERLLAHDRFRMQVVYPPLRMGRPSWKIDPHFNLDRHLDFRRLDPPGSEDQLMELVSQLMGTPLDRHLPLWHLSLVSGVGDGGAVIARLHHSIGDGFALMRVLISLTDPAPHSNKSGEDLLEVPKRATALANPGDLKVKPRKLIDLARAYGTSAGDLSKLILEHEPLTPFRGTLGTRKIAAFTRPLSLALVKEARARARCTVNDFLLTALTGGLRKHLQGMGTEPIDTLSLRAVVPVDLRRPGKDQPLGNRFGMVFLGLPVGLEDPRARLAEVQKRMNALKGSPQAVVVLGLLSAVGSIPQEMQHTVVELFGSKATAVVTNVPGPSESLYLAGEKIGSLMFWVPQSGRLGLGVSILSYDGEVRIGVATDALLATCPRQLARDVEEAFEELLDAIP